MAELTVLLMAAAALGSGASLLRLLTLDRAVTSGSRVIWSFVLGIGLLGWLLFFVTIARAVSPLALTIACAACVPGLVFLWRPGEQIIFPTLSPVRLLLAGGIAAALIFDVLEGLSPPADADSLAYHFAIPKLFLQAGGLVFVPRANDGAVPMLQQLTYLAALGMGGERAMTLWTMLTGWAAAGATYSIARRHIGIEWALAATLAFLTTPAVIYGGGSGQVETRNAAFVLIAAAAAVLSKKEGDARYAALAGAAAGFYAASKYPGVLFIAACALPLLFQRRWVVCCAAYGLAALVAGGQWYAWNAWNTGDPVFPMLYGWLPYSEGIPWDAAQNAFYRTTHAGEKPVPATLLFFFLYPLEATFSTLDVFDSRLVGFGPLALVLLPSAVVGAWLCRSSIRQSPLAGIAVICLVAYALWFFLGPSLRVRFHLPLYPLLLLCLIAAAARAVRMIPDLRGPIAAGLTASLLFQVGVHAVFTVNYARHLMSGESRDAFLTRNVSFYAGVEWLNAHLGSQHRVAVFNREVNYLLNVPYFYLNTFLDSRIDTRLGADDSEKLWKQLLAQQLTHVLADRSIIDRTGKLGIGAGLGALEQQGCLSEAVVLPTQSIASRTLSRGHGTPVTASILELTPQTCTWESTSAHQGRS